MLRNQTETPSTVSVHKSALIYSGDLAALIVLIAGPTTRSPCKLRVACPEAKSELFDGA